ncbi:MAG: nicotinate (nicotinamide) nucleotide adenylyltransferase [Rikenellaceae bacterium]|jgi:nicotinate-nucleotide adenylyltransferase|nr:nicotinate (nicotinamide) nucleotide adenylyltransferase [Rikenellaceae bacterium]
MTEPKRILLYFGSFNPTHNAHIAIAEYAIEQDLADEVVLVVSPHNPHKDARGLASEFHRYEMASLAAAASKYPDRILVSLVEMTLPKPSYTINTLRFLAREFPDTRFSILMGGDLVAKLDTWREAGEIIANYDIYVYPRPYEDDIVPVGERMHILWDAPLSDISSTAVRAHIAKGETIKELMPREVAAYIDKHRLWK